MRTVDICDFLKVGFFGCCIWQNFEMKVIFDHSFCLRNPQLFKMSRRKELFRMARQLVVFGAMTESAARCGGGKKGKKARDGGDAGQGSVAVCLHDFCGEACTATKIKDKQVRIF